MQELQNQQELKLHLHQTALEAGFQIFGVAPAIPPPHGEEFLQWLAKGAHADMAWMERGQDKRLDLEKILPGVRSVICLGMSYWQGAPPSAADTAAHGRIARYAWGSDYHDLIWQRMRSLEAVLEKAGGVQKAYCDTGPILERDFAERAGLGWAGKSTMLLNRKLGTWFFLSEILTTLELPPDAPTTGHCGKCTRCLDACPTGAITAPHQLDARRCLSYWTIENKGTIPLEFRHALGDRIYGCDDCLDACPWNRFAEASREAEFQARPATHGWPLRNFLALDDAAFRALFRGSPIKRIKRERFLRNVCVALGNVGHREDLPALQRTAQDPSPLLQEHATWAIEEIEARHPI
jgi:epoxyqueuosine reductase